MKRDERQSLIMIWFNYGLNWNKYVDPWLNIGMLCMQELFFLGVGGLLETLWVMSNFLQKERRVLTRK